MTAVKQQDWLTDFDLYLFGEGKHHSIYEKLGAHLTEREGQWGVYFAVWAPNAREVGVVGDFNNWDSRKCKMTRNQMGIWEAFVPGLKAGEKYKYAIENAHGHCCLTAVIFIKNYYGFSFSSILTKQLTMRRLRLGIHCQLFILNFFALKDRNPRN